MSIYQTQFNEAMHQYLKDAGRRLTNGCQSGPAEEVVVPGYKRLVNGEVQQVPEHTKSMNTISETQQLLGLSIVKKALYAKCTTTGEKDVEYKRMIQKEMSRKVAGDKKLERDFSKKYPSK